MISTIGMVIWLSAFSFQLSEKAKNPNFPQFLPTEKKEQNFSPFREPKLSQNKKSVSEKE
jgi:hypothetical protein